MPGGTTFDPVITSGGFKDFWRHTNAMGTAAKLVTNANGAALGAGCMVGAIHNTGAAQTNPIAVYDSNSTGDLTQPLFVGTLTAAGTYGSCIELNLELKRGLVVVAQTAGVNQDVLISHSG